MRCNVPVENAVLWDVKSGSLTEIYQFLLDYTVTHPGKQYSWNVSLFRCHHMCCHMLDNRKFFFRKPNFFVIILLLVVTSVYDWQDKLVSIIFGMLRQKHFHFIDTYKDEAFTTIKAVVKQVIVLVYTEKSLNNSI